MNGVVKWFSEGKGYGFLAAEDEESIFVHYSSIQMEGLKTLQVGQKVQFNIVYGPKGPQAANVIPMSEEQSEHGDIQHASSNEETIAFALYEDKIRLVSLANDGQCRFIDEFSNLHNLVYTYSSETQAMKAAVDELETLINDPNTKENDIQDFFERRQDFILRDEYKCAHPHVVLEREEGSLIPDFVLEPVDQNATCDLLELKLPSAPVFVLKENRMRFSWAVMEACAQLREYQRYFDEKKNRIAVQNKYGLAAYLPRVFVIIGRRGHVDPFDYRRMQSDMPSLELRTYDQVLAIAQAKLEKMKRGSWL